MTVPMTAALAGADIAAENGAVVKVGHRGHGRYYRHRRGGHYGRGGYGRGGYYRHGGRYRQHRRYYDYDDDFSSYGGFYYGLPALAFSFGGYYSQPYLGDSGGSCSYWRNQCARNWGYRNRNYYGCLRYQGCR
jgi:hypothetical protein